MAKFYRSMSADISKINSTVLGWLSEELDNSYWVLVEFAVQGKNCDFAILGEDKIVVLEVKALKYAVKGSSNSTWTQLKTGYRLAISSTLGYPSNPIGQARKIGDSFGSFLQANLHPIFGSQEYVQPQRLKVFPFVVIPKPNKDNQLKADDDFCWIAQGRADFFQQFHSKAWATGLHLSGNGKARIVELLGLESVNPARLYPQVAGPTPIFDGQEAVLVAESETEQLPAALLTLQYADGHMEKFALTERITPIGRSQQYPIVLALPRASRQHCLIEYVNNHFFIKDMHSKHGTFIGGARLSPGSPYLLKEGTVIDITESGLRMIFHQ